MEYDMIQSIHDNGGDTGKVSGLSTEFTKHLADYVKRVKAAIAQVSGAGASSDDDKKYLVALNYWGADSAFLSDVVMCEYLDLKAKAMDDLDKLPAQWPDSSDVLQKATVYEVQQHIAAGEITQASEHIDEMKQAHPAEANALMQLVIGKLRKQIHDLENKPDKAAEFKKQCDMYLKFAAELLKTHPNDYAFTQMRADALLVNRQFDEALTMFEQLAKTEQDNRVASEKKADEFVDKLAGAMDKAQGNIPDVLRLAEGFPKILKDRGMDASTKGYAGALATVFAYAKGTTTDPADAEERAKQVVQAYKAAMSGLRKDLKVGIPRDSVNMAGLAKLYYLQKKYDKALENYNPLVAGLWVTATNKNTPEDVRKPYLAQYAQALLDRTQCEYEYFMTTPDPQKKKTQMQNLVLKIKELRNRDSELWGMYAGFNKIESDAKNIAGIK
jgi:tetratricopeptide (TPR) repeat protein